MNNYYTFIFILLTGLASSCTSKNEHTSKSAFLNDSICIQKTDSMNIYTLLASNMTNTVRLDSFLDKITHQEKVKILTRLNTKWDEKNKIYIYSDSNYIFKLRQNGIVKSGNQTPNSIFIDGPYSISFKNYHITCYQDSVFRCEDYGFNLYNTLQNPKIIEVGGKRFLYADLSYSCTGIGCGCFLTFIYDIETHKPTFIENYRIPYKGFFVSDFNNDNNPDLLVISRTLQKKMKGFDLEEFQLRLTPFLYSKGAFKPYVNGRFPGTCCYELYSFTNVYHHSYHDKLIYSITNDNWLRQ